MISLFILLFLLEALYLLVSNVLVSMIGHETIAGELVRSAVRLVFLLIYVYFYRKYFLVKSNFTAAAKNNHALLYLALALVLFYPILTVYHGFDLPTKTVFALTSVIVGFREEIFYRAIVQNSLNRRMGVIPAILITSVLFTASHVQYVMNFWVIDLIHVFLMSIIFGMIYYRFQSLVLNSVYHSVYDIVFAFGPYLFMLPKKYSLFAVVAGVVLVLMWDQMLRKKKVLSPVWK